jgi:hypothetical protein
MVELLPGTPDELIRVKLHHRTLSDMPTCSAVSYEWGFSVRQHEISCSGRILKVTANLALLLSKFRKPKSSQLLWIDAICINQDDVNERSQQVSIMGEIYKNAEVVLLWIGDEVPHTKDALSILRQLAKESSVLKLKPGGAPFDYDKYEPSDLSAKRRLEEILIEPSWPAVTNLLSSRSYFLRLWIIQEVALASKALVACGDHRIDWKTFFEAAVFVWSCPALVKGWNSLRILHQIVEIGSMTFDEFPRSMSGLLGKFPNSQATEPRDYVYALLGLPQRRLLGCDICVDYSKAVGKVFQDATEYCFAQDQQLWLFERQSIEPSSRSEFAVPSWVSILPHWVLHRLYPFVPEIQESLGVVQTFSIKGDILTACGVILDTVALVTENFSANNIKRIILQAFSNMVSIIPKQTPNLIHNAAHKTFQMIRSIGVEEEDFSNILSQWLLEELELLPSVLEQNPKLGGLAETKSQAQRRFADELQDDMDNLDFVHKNAVWEWSIEHLSKGDGLRFERLQWTLFKPKGPKHALAVNLFRTSTGFSGFGPFGGNNSPDMAPAVQVGDCLALFPTVERPMIIRGCGDGTYNLIGIAHVGNILEIPWFEGELPKTVPLRIR